MNLINLSNLPELLNGKFDECASIPVACCNATLNCPIGGTCWLCWTACALDDCCDEFDGVRPPDPEPSVERLWLLAESRIFGDSNFY